MKPEEHTPTYLLNGEALKIAMELQRYHDSVDEEYQALLQRIAEYSQVLMSEFDLKHNDNFQGFFDRLADALAIPRKDMRRFRLDVTYLEDHGLAFMKQGPLNDNVMDLDQNTSGQSGIDILREGENEV